MTQSASLGSAQKLSRFQIAIRPLCLAPVMTGLRKVSLEILAQPRCCPTGQTELRLDVTVELVTR